MGIALDVLLALAFSPARAYYREVRDAEGWLVPWFCRQGWKAAKQPQVCPEIWEEQKKSTRNQYTPMGIGRGGSAL
jgi:hypothetical protein